MLIERHKICQSKQTSNNTINEAILFFSFYQWIEPYVDEHAQHFVKQIAASLATKWDKHYSETVGFVRTRLVFAIVRSAGLCLIEGQE